MDSASTPDQLGRLLVANPHVYVVLSGFCDSLGSEAYNIRLSQRRAESVRQYFIREFGISPSFVGAIGVGPQQLKDKQNPASAANRRVEITTKPSN